MIVIHYDELENSSRLVESVLPLQVIDVTSSLFIANTEMSINLRNFSDQIARFATLCDIVLYGPKAETFAEIISCVTTTIGCRGKSAGKRAVIHANKIEYKTIIIKDDFSVYENNYPEFVMYDSTGLSKRRLDFWELENMQMRKMSGANEVTKNVWIGNIMFGIGEKFVVLTDICSLPEEKK
ncbi:hypothetical protein INT48_009258, partial [Thamnidium elegans]